MITLDAGVVMLDGAGDCDPVTSVLRPGDACVRECFSGVLGVGGALEWDTYDASDGMLLLLLLLLSKGFCGVMVIGLSAVSDRSEGSMV